jgi:hypothetical protein
MLAKKHCKGIIIGNSKWNIAANDILIEKHEIKSLFNKSKETKNDYKFN